jgi:hypothetical protein
LFSSLSSPEAVSSGAIKSHAIALFILDLDVCLKHDTPKSVRLALPSLFIRILF